MWPRAGWLLRLRPYAALLGLCLLLYLPGQAAIPPLDRDEARFAQATRQMLESGDFLHIRFQNEARNAKPAGIYWLQAAAVRLFSTPRSTAIWPYRVPSLLGASLAVLLAYGLGAALFRDAGEPSASRRTALLGAVLLASALGVVAEAHIAKTDAALLAAVTAAQGTLGLAYVRRRAGRPVPAMIATAFWGAEIVGVFLKGPVILALAAVTAAALSLADRDAAWLRGLRPAAGIVALVAAVGPWLLAIEHATAGRFLADSLGHDLGAKLLGGQELHGAPPLYYLLLAFVTFWPGSLLLVPALARAWRCRDRPAERFLLAWLVPGWIALELVPTKLPHYALPLYPALALLAAAALAEGIRPAAGRWLRRVGIVAVALWGVATVGVAAALALLPMRFAEHPAPAAIGGALILLGIAVAAWRHRGSGSTARTGLVAPALSLVFVVTAAFAVLPRLDRLWLSRAAAGLVARHPPVPGAPLVAVGYGEPSLVFLLGSNLRLLRPDAAAAALAGGGEALVGSRDDATFRRELRGRGLVWRPRGSIAGLDYSNGQSLVLTLYDIAPG